MGKRPQITVISSGERCLISAHLQPAVATANRLAKATTKKDERAQYAKEAGLLAGQIEALRPQCNRKGNCGATCTGIQGTAYRCGS